MATRTEALAQIEAEYGMKPQDAAGILDAAYQNPTHVNSAYFRVTWNRDYGYVVQARAYPVTDPSPWPGFSIALTRDGEPTFGAMRVCPLCAAIVDGLEGQIVHTAWHAAGNRLCASPDCPVTAEVGYHTPGVTIFMCDVETARCISPDDLAINWLMRVSELQRHGATLTDAIMTANREYPVSES